MTAKRNPRRVALYVLRAMKANVSRMTGVWDQRHAGYGEPLASDATADDYEGDHR